MENAAKTPDKAALIRPGMEEISYRQLRRHIIGARNYLIRAGVHPGEYVILSADRSFSFVYAYLAIHSIGAVAVPLDPHTPAPRLKYICDLLLPKAGFWISGDHGMTDITVFKESGEVLAKPLGARTSCPQILEKCGQNARVPGKTGGFARTSSVKQKYYAAFDLCIPSIFCNSCRVDSSMFSACASGASDRRCAG